MEDKKDGVLMIPYVVYEAAQSRAERIGRRLIIRRRFLIGRRLRRLFRRQLVKEKHNHRFTAVIFLTFILW